MPEWYVVAKEPKEGNYHVDVFGPFKNDADAKAFALDEAEEGWASIEAVYITHEIAEDLATNQVFWPYEPDEE